MSTSERSPAELLATPVQFLKGVGPERAELLLRLGLKTARDVLFFFPRDYQDLTAVRPIGELTEGELVCVQGEVVEVDARTLSDGRTLFGVLIRQGPYHLRAVWFNQPFMEAKFRHGQQVLFSGKVKRPGYTWEMSHPRVQWLDNDEQPAAIGLAPVYPLTEGLNQGQVRRIVQGVVETCGELVDEVFPEEYLAAHNLLPLRQALLGIHQPKTAAMLSDAQRRFIYQELLILQLALAVRRRQQHERSQAIPLEATARIDARIRRLFPFELTAGQLQAIAEVAADLGRTQPMSRLLQGDVGSGKTVVALYAILLAVAHGCQAALMAPTEVLARQHFQTLARFLIASQVRCGSLTGALSATERRDVLQQIASGQIDVVLGTQAILQEDVEFQRLALVVIDEQHKFGVRQRALLKQAGADPHYLVMTATPIPRTVAMTLYGDLDVSTIHESPPGRQTIHTYLAGPEQREKWWQFVARKLREGRQAYVITPLVDEAEELPVANLQESYEELANGPLEAFRLGLLHGRMSPGDKETAMDAFRSGRTQVLIATTVVEVGIDVPNATLMTVEGAERFGLSQLHQLRGRLSRGAHPGFCCLFADPKTDDARKRLEAFASTTDGFRLAELDFAHRGPGDLLGTRQHGLPPLRIADLRRDTAVLDEARRDAQQLVDLDLGLSRPEHQRLRKMVIARYGRVLELGDVG